MKPPGIILVALLSASVAALVTYLALTNRQLRRELAEREHLQAQTALAGTATNQAPGPVGRTSSPVWRPTRLAQGDRSAGTVPSVAPPASRAESASGGTLLDSARSTPPVPVTGIPVIVAPAGGWVRYEAAPGSKCSVKGSSSIHAWELIGTIIGGHLDLPAGFESLRTWPDGRPVPVSADVRIPVRTLKSYQKKMDEMVQEAMHMNQHPNIGFQLLELWPGSASTNLPPEFTATGELVINGVTNRIQMPVQFSAPEPGKLNVSGQVPLKMSQFEIQPPVPGSLSRVATVDDNVTVSFDWALKPRSPAQTP